MVGLLATSIIVVVMAQRLLPPVLLDHLPGHKLTAAVVHGAQKVRGHADNRRRVVHLAGQHLGAAVHRPKGVREVDAPAVPSQRVVNPQGDLCIG